MKLTFPDNVNTVIALLEERGFEAYAVGGCVRDLLLGRTPNDFDITTNAKPEEVKGIFRRTVDTGIQHGTVTVLLQDDALEVTTYRVDGVYEDGRHPSGVTFSAHLREDLMRRDFTINAMAYHPVRGLVDLYGGEEDLAQGIIRCVGDPNERLDEDALRILRALRFAAQLGFTIDPATEEAVRSHAEDLQKISAERIREELMKLITSDHPGMIRTVYRDGISRVILPELDPAMTMPQRTPYHLYTVGEHTVRAMEAIAPEPVLRLTMLLHDLGKVRVHTEDSGGQDHFNGHAAESAVMAKEILRRLKFDNETIRKVTKLVEFHDLRPHPTEVQVRRALVEVGPALFDDYLAVQRADAVAKNPERLGSAFERIAKVEEIGHKILQRGDPLSIADLAITGEDLKSIGIGEGREIGQILNAALMAVLEEPSLNDKDLLLIYAQQMHFR